MSRIPPAGPAQYEPLFGTDTPLRQQVFAQAPHIAGPYIEFMSAVRANRQLPARLVELVRLRVAFHNQCRTCMSLRYTSDDGAAAVGEGLVCSLEKPEEAADLSYAEKAAITLADLMATDHLAVDDALFERLRQYFSPGELMELCFRIAGFVGYGRMLAVLAITDDLPAAYGDLSQQVAPWTTTGAQTVATSP
jgi:alkylhydroperoxidase family enzyme